MGRNGKKDSRGGRPRLGQGAAREHRITVRLNDEEREQILLKSQAASLDASTFLREAGLGKRLSMQAASHPVNMQTYKQLRRLGTNLNQLLKMVHAGFVMPLKPKQIEPLQHLLIQVGRELCGDRKADEG